MIEVRTLGWGTNFRIEQLGSPDSKEQFWCQSWKVIYSICSLMTMMSCIMTGLLQIEIVLPKNVYLTNATSKFLMTSLIGHLTEIAMGRFHECFVMGTYLQKFDEWINVCSQCAHSSSLYHQFVALIFLEMGNVMAS